MRIDKENLRAQLHDMTPCAFILATCKKLSQHCAQLWCENSLPIKKKKYSTVTAPPKSKSLSLHPMIVHPSIYIHAS